MSHRPDVSSETDPFKDFEIGQCLYGTPFYPNLVGKLSGHAEGSKAFARYRDIDEEMQKELVKMLE